MKMIRLTLSDGTLKEMSNEDVLLADLREALDGKAIIKTEFFEEDGT